MWAYGTHCLTYVRLGAALFLGAGLEGAPRAEPPCGSLWCCGARGCALRWVCAGCCQTVKPRRQLHVGDILVAVGVSCYATGLAVIVAAYPSDMVGSVLCVRRCVVFTRRLVSRGPLLVSLASISCWVQCTWPCCLPWGCHQPSAWLLLLLRQTNCGSPLLLSGAVRSRARCSAFPLALTT